jgi:dnd system-associated protein 4
MNKSVIRQQWRWFNMPMIYIDGRHKDLAEKLAKTPAKDLSRPIFNNYMQLMVFAAMIGNRCGTKSKVSSKNGNEVESQVFENERNRMDGLVYLTALHEAGSGEILRDTRENEIACWKYFEGYAGRGFEEMENWMLDNPSDSDGVETIITEMKKVALELVEGERDQDSLENISF